MKVNCFEIGTFPSVFVAYQARPCYHCEEPSCLDVCPEDAITKRETDGIVVVDQDLCSGCQACLDACPYGAPQFEDDEDSKMQKCDLCQVRWSEGKAPICVDACPTRALDAGPLDELIETYGSAHEAVGFEYAEEVKPSVVFKLKR
jgi:anaerobic dimethyl sulfoxide reductase subunit B (iron-sulfur subunit)